jgi:hypothetical protein
MGLSVIYSQKPRAGARGRVPWPIPERPRLVSICRSPLAAYSIVVALEAWAADDPRAVASFRCQRHAKGRAFADTLLLQRVPLSNLNEEAAVAIFEGLASWLRDRARLEVSR